VGHAGRRSRRPTGRAARPAAHPAIRRSIAAARAARRRRRAHCGRYSRAHTPTARQTALFSATLPEWVAGTARKHLRQPVTVSVDALSSTPPEIEHIVYDVDPAEELGALQHLLDRRGDGPLLVFGRTKHGVKKLALKLQQL